MSSEHFVQTQGFNVLVNFSAERTISKDERVQGGKRLKEPKH